MNGVFERATQGAIAAACALALICGVLLAAASPAAASSGVASILRSVNASRVALGLKPLVLRSDLTSVAQTWSTRMARANRLSHNPRLGTQVTNFRWAGENVGYGPTWIKVQQAFMNSTPHRANLLDRGYTEIGIGLVVSGQRVWITQVFRQPIRALARAAAPVSRVSVRPALT